MTPSAGKLCACSDDAVPTHQAVQGRVPLPRRRQARRVGPTGPRSVPAAAPTGRLAARTGPASPRARAGRRPSAARRSEEWALAPKDRGPVRALARDYVDSRRRISEFYMYGLGVLVILLFLPATRLIVDYLVLGVVLVMLSEGILLGRQILRLAAERYPGERTRGVRMYAALRAMQIRKLRMPAPRVKPGDTV